MIDDFMKPRCPVEVGDYFYRTNYCIETGAVLPDRIQVMSVTELENPIVINELKGQYAYYKIRGRYIYHAIGSDIEKDFCETIFDNPDWVIEHKRSRRR